MPSRLTGTTGKPISDSLSRGLVVAAIQGIAAFIAVRTDWLTSEDLVLLTPAITLLAFITWGAYDRWLRKQLPG